MLTDTYQVRLRRHLTEYREKRLGVRETGTFTHKGVTRRYGHILPIELKWLNIPEPFRRQVRDYTRDKRIKLHDGFHHLNSSQVLALALFCPYLKGHSKDLARALSEPVMNDVELEFVPDRREGTNVDVSWTGKGARTYCEVKLTEQGFGGADDDARHLKKLEEIYAPVLAPYVDDALLSRRRFFRDYQILRNLWLAARPGHEEDRVIFLMPKRNLGPNKQLESLLPLIGTDLRNRVRIVHLENLLGKLAADRTVGGLGWYAEMLQEKYIPA